jgi:hypothetical protein
MPYFWQRESARGEKAMTSGKSLHMPAIGMFVVAALLALGCAPASAQTIANPGQPSAATTRPAKPAPKRPPANAANEQGTDYWAINTDVGKYSRETPAERTLIDRRPLKTSDGSVGFTSAPIRAGTLADGRAVPGLERHNQDPQSYVGMSLSLTSTNKGFPLVPAPNISSSNW